MFSGVYISLRLLFDEEIVTARPASGRPTKTSKFRLIHDSCVLLGWRKKKRMKKIGPDPPLRNRRVECRTATGAVENIRLPSGFVPV